MRTITAALLGFSLAAGSAGLAQAADVDVGVSIGISQPGVYGRIDIGRFPQPAVIVSRPVIIAPAPVVHQPVYLWVPPGHRKNWRKHCHQYGACAAPVYFVQDQWYDRHVMVERHHEHPGRGHGKGHGKGRGKDD